LSLRNQPQPEDQRNVIVATVLVAIITFVWMFWLAPQPTPQNNQGPTAADTQQVEESPPPATAQADADTAAAAAPPASELAAEAEPTDEGAASTAPDDPVLAGARSGTERMITVDTDKYVARFSTRGATLHSFRLKEYMRFDRTTPVQLVDTTGRGALALGFTTPNNRLVDTRDLYFTADVSEDTLRVTEGERSITFEAQLGEGVLRQTFTFQPDAYDVGLQIQQENGASFATQDGYELIWDGGLPFSEGGTDTEQQNTGVYAYSGGELVGVTVADEDHDEQRINGDISWVAVKNKYFTSVLMPDDPDLSRGADLIGDLTGTRGGSEADWKNLVARLQMGAPASADATDRFHLYLGPIYYNNLAGYNRDLYDMVDYGWDYFEWMTRPLAKYFFIPIFTFLNGFIPSYGIVIILLAIFVKMLVYPLTKSSYRSMAQMRELQPQLEEIKEQYGDDPQKQQEEMMKMYKETGVNPLGGCLPMFLQYPIIIALYQFLPQSIQLRHESFLWASDLSVPDKILQLPFEIPIYGDYVAGFTVLMGLAMVVQMRVQSTPGSGAQAKVFMYLMPGFIFFIFNQFASALSLYYLVYNIVSAAQQQWINMQLEKEKDEDGKLGSRSNGRNGQGEEKKGFLARLVERAEAAAEEQRR
jgi:YidC/Oxa1 family membrane protein insertase